MTDAALLVLSAMLSRATGSQARQPRLPGDDSIALLGGVFRKHRLLLVVGFQYDQSPIADGAVGLGAAPPLGIAENWPRD